MRYDKGKIAKIAAQDLFSTYLCAADPAMRAAAEKAFAAAYAGLKETISAKDPIRLWVDGSYNAKGRTAGIGMIIEDGDRRIAFGKPVNAKTSLSAELYALSIGLSYVLDACPEARDVHVMYDCVNAVAHAMSADALAALGAPYTNFRSALKRIRKRRMNVLFEHVEAHAGESRNEDCDLIAKHYARIGLAAPQRRRVTAMIGRKGAKACPR